MRFIVLTIGGLLLAAATTNAQNMKEKDVNVFGEPLEVCSTDPMTGYYRDGRCSTGPTDYGTHVVAAVMTDEFLAFTKSRGNDLSTPAPQYRFPGLKPGDGWCLCVSRWKEAYDAGKAPPVNLAATHQKALDVVTLDMLKEHAINRAPEQDD